MHFDILSIFPEMFEGPFNESVVKRAQEMELVTVAIHNLRDYTTDKHRTTDDVPYGGRGGMVMKPEPIFRAVESVLGEERDKTKVILLSPQGRLFSQKVAHELSALPRIFLICGHYEGVDERVAQHLADEELSIGDYILTGGELAAIVTVDAVTRLIPGVLGDPEATIKDSYAQGLLEHPQYTRPPEFLGYKVPEVLLSGNHAEIARWRRREALRRTFLRRPDLLAQAELGEEDRQFLRELEAEQRS